MKRIESVIMKISTAISAFKRIRAENYQILIRGSVVDPNLKANKPK